MASAFCFGLAAATALTLLATPAVYVALERLRARCTGQRGQDPAPAPCPRPAPPPVSLAVPGRN
ncbi:MAG: hypothetical protein KatS3mg102_2541 [Planctomycetota bacterium]|nr:MAG: hypothetical protein KatS3mg102_2541 [Planctomycetota bacterium]